MRHRVKAKHFNRDVNHRKMLLRNLVRSLVEQGEITTTQAKAKETKRWADKLIGQAQSQSLATRRRLHRFFGTTDVVNTLVDKVAPAMNKRTAGFSRITNLGQRRGDNTELVKLSLVEKPESLGTLKSGKQFQPKNKPAKVKIQATARLKKTTKPTTNQKAKLKNLKNPSKPTKAKSK
ncbi:MAG TPA: 50S ribosomal protein L17 [Patescibacteria group bacterium]|jgi:large subunit ribosomal protein L17